MSAGPGAPDSVADVFYPVGTRVLARPLGLGDPARPGVVARVSPWGRVLDIYEVNLDDGTTFGCLLVEELSPLDPDAGR